MLKKITMLVAITFLLLMGTLVSSGCSAKPIYIQQPFLGFTTYELPEKVKIEVDRNCVAPYIIDDVPTEVKVGDCVNIKDVKKLVTKIKTLEKIVENYELDIKAYNRLHGEKK